MQHQPPEQAGVSINHLKPDAGSLSWSAGPRLVLINLEWPDPGDYCDDRAGGGGRIISMNDPLCVAGHGRGLSPVPDPDQAQLSVTQ